MELRHLRYFTVVAKHLHFSEAANELNISQPPLSKQIKQLEEELGITLLKRNNRKVELTEAGKYFYKSAIRILNVIEKDIEIARNIDYGEIGSLTIGFGGTVVYDLLPKIIKQVKVNYPNIKLEVRQLTTSDQIKSLLEGEIDVGILVPPVEEENISTLSIREELFVACVPGNHRLANNDSPVDIKEFKHDPIIMTPEKSGKGYYHSVINLCRNAGFYPNIEQTAQEQQTIVSLVASELGVAFVPQSTKRVVHENVKYLPLLQEHKKVTALAWHKGNYIPAVNLFIDLIKEHFVEV
ncbi:LysR family transcriptional regulator [Oceanobacillus jeddahense]|uniref:LysR family transcriptional regulator n=1 Tax=Oceanobacillus jeddahense TaxID=1462527 RepID=UPI000595D0D7|nr:LysR family transcriptional regulator [Oceanobacillus jeddahense]